MKIVNEEFPKKKVLCSDLHDTIVETLSGRIFPGGIWDMEFKFDTLDAIKNYGFENLFIFSNQGDIERGLLDEQHFLAKMNYVKYALMEYLGILVEYDYYKFNNSMSHFRKPNPGMLEVYYERTLPKRGIMVTKEEMMMIGDASGGSRWSDVDLQTAKNFGIDYMDVDDFIRRFGG